MHRSYFLRTLACKVKKKMSEIRKTAMPSFFQRENAMNSFFYRPAPASLPVRRKKLFTALSKSIPLLACLWFALIWLALAGPARAAWPLSPAAAQPVAVTAEFYRINPAAPNGDTLALLLTLTPQPGAYLYAGPSLAPKGGKPTQVLFAEGYPRADTLRILYPAPEEKVDPWQQNARVKVYTGPVNLIIPIRPPDQQTFGSGAPTAPEEPLRLRVAGLACTPRNCTPFSLNLSLPWPADPTALPQAEQQPWWPDPASLRVEVAGAFRPTPEQGTSIDAATQPGPAGPKNAAAVLFKKKPTSLPDLFPIFHAPSLEVASLGKALLFGFLAGIILNVMPCVLPVLGLKLGALLRRQEECPADQQRREAIRHQLFFILGILTWFTCLGLLLAWAGIAWGQLFQSPALVLGLAVFLLLLALNLFGVFNLPILDITGRSRASGTPAAESSSQAFVSGFAATLLATPCSGPLLGGVLGWALLQPPGILLLTLWSVGLGMASPYILLLVKPGLIRFLPRPGHWMHTLEHLLAFLLLGTVVYLTGLLPQALLPKALTALLLSSFAAWLWGQIGGPAAKPSTRLIARTAACILVVLALFLPLSTPDPEQAFTWQPFSREQFNNDFGKERLLVEFTADWCPTCKVMEATTLTEERMIAWKKRYGFLPVRVDLTRDNPAGQELLRRLHSASIPLIALFGLGDSANKPLVLRDIVTPGQLEGALTSAFLTRKEQKASPDSTLETEQKAL